MSDMFSKRKRSEIMSLVKSNGNVATELAVIKLLRASKITGWRRGLPLPGKPDIAFPARRVALFVDGCFWHRCPQHSTVPVTNRRFWSDKLNRNVIRDRRVTRLLEERGWRVLRLWQHELRHPKYTLKRIRRTLQNSVNHGKKPRAA